MITIKQSIPTLQDFVLYSPPEGTVGTNFLSGVSHFHSQNKWIASMSSNILRVLAPDWSDKFVEWARKASEATGEDITVDIVKYNDDSTLKTENTRRDMLENLLKAVQDLPYAFGTKSRAKTIESCADYLVLRGVYSNTNTMVLWLKGIASSLSTIEERQKNEP